ncbi:transcriptional regulator [Pedobacter kyungheensis]|uniref:Transcriptional regulator n=1 Tax=Pedobacter kyungheensis TaxID=1069985 RepID=A0A0C1FTB6_9SPHI|nr:helix-turn-helix transcriptional regulator [Pedobacter kyungheensis]KIA96152.1 transcriptional regulator [Pedobacter kyungheensis]
MAAVKKIDTVKSYNEEMGAETRHPLVNVVNFDEIATYTQFSRQMGLYCIFLKNVKCGDMRYGCQPYDYEGGTLVFIAPGQVYGIDDGGSKIKPSGMALVFHPDLIAGTGLAKKIREYTFFSYAVNEALHLSESERSTVVDCLNKITEEIKLISDRHSKTLIVSNIELLLNYCLRFYHRQFITRTHVTGNILSRFENLLDDYFSSGKSQQLGLPGVSYFAEQLHLSPNYFGDLIKKETGNKATDFIQRKLIEEVKARICIPDSSISETAMELGFKYPQHLTRLFKQKVGLTPDAFRRLN